MIVNAIWIGKTSPLPLAQQMCMNSWIAHGHEYHLWTYAPVSFAITERSGTIVIHDAREIMPEPIYRYEDQNHAGSPVLHANLFRYKFLCERGGAFVDADTLCLRSFDLSNMYVFSSEKWGDIEKHPNFAFVNIPQSHSGFSHFCMDEAFGRLEGDRHWGRFGPAILKEGITGYGLDKFVTQTEAFCSVHWNETQKFFEDKDSTPLPDSIVPATALGVHLWQQVMRKNGRDLNADYPATSLWSQWKDEYL